MEQLHSSAVEQRALFPLLRILAVAEGETANQGRKKFPENHKE